MTRHKDSFQILNILKNGEGKGSFLIVAHKDFDGLVSAYFLAKVLSPKYKKIDLVFSRPNRMKFLAAYLLRVQADKIYKNISIVDIAANHSNFNHTKSFLDKFEGQLSIIFDHHHGWDSLLNFLKYKDTNVFMSGELKCSCPDSSNLFVFSPVSSCAQLIYDWFSLHEKEDYFLDTLLCLANMADDLLYKSKITDETLIEYFKAIRNNSLLCCLEAVKKEDLDSLDYAVDWYNISTEKSKEAITQGKEIFPGIFYIHLYDTSIDYTVLCEHVYKHYDILISKDINVKARHISFTVSHKLEDLNLVEVFKLRSGSPKKVTLHRKNLTIYSILDVLKEYLVESV